MFVGKRRSLFSDKGSTFFISDSVFFHRSFIGLGISIFICAYHCIYRKRLLLLYKELNINN